MSTLLQKGFFANIADINFATHELESGHPLREAVLKICRANQMQYDSNQIRETFKNECDPTLPTVISSELFVWHGIVPERYPYCDKVIIAERLKELFPSAKVLIVLRNQFNLLQSLYSQLYSAIGFSPSFFSFDKWLEINILGHKKQVNSFFSVIDYYEIIKLYQSLFPDVKVVLFEEIKPDPELFISEELSPFLDLSEDDLSVFFENKVFNKRHSKSEILINKWISGTIVTLQKKLGNPQRVFSEEKRKKIVRKFREFASGTKLGKVDSRFQAKHKEYISDVLKEGNRKISKEFDLDLEKYGYPV